MADFQLWFEQKGAYLEFAYEDYVGFRVDKHVMSVPCIHTLFRTRRLFAVQRSLYLSWIIIEQASMSAFLFFSHCGIPDSFPDMSRYDSHVLRSFKLRRKDEVEPEPAGLMLGQPCLWG